MAKYKNFIITNVMLFLLVVSFIVFGLLNKKYDFAGCVILDNLHIYCIGCGGTRSVLALLSFDIISAVRYNVAVPLGVIIFLYYDIRTFVEIKRNNKAYFSKEKYLWFYVFLGVLIVNCIVKNFLLFKGIDLIGDVLK